MPEIPNNDKIFPYLDGELPVKERQLFERLLKAEESLKIEFESLQAQERVLESYFAAQSSMAKRIPRPDFSSVPSAALIEKRSERRRHMLYIFIAATSCVLLLAVLGAPLIISRQARQVVGQVLSAVGTPQLFREDGFTIIDPTEGLDSGIRRLKTPSGSQLKVALHGDLGYFEMNANSSVRIGRDGNAVNLLLEHGEVLVQSKGDGKVQVRTRSPEMLITGEDSLFSVVKGLRGTEVVVFQGEVVLTQPGAERKISQGNAYSTEGVLPIAPVQRIRWSSSYEEIMASLPNQVKESLMSSSQGFHFMSGELLDLEALKSMGPTSSRYFPGEVYFLLEFADMEPLREFFLSGDFVSIFDQIIDSPVSEMSAEERRRAREFRNYLISVVESNDFITFIESFQGSMSFAVMESGDAFLISQYLGDESRFESFTRLIDNAVDASNFDEEVHLSDKVNFTIVNNFLILGSAGEDFEEIVHSISELSPGKIVESEFWRELRQVSPIGGYGVAMNINLMMQKMAEAEAANRVPSSASRAIRRLGLLNMRSIMAGTDMKDQGGNQALRVNFDGERQGFMSWLDEPSALGGIKYFSPSAQFVVSAKVKRPHLVLNDVLDWLNEDGQLGTDEEIAKETEKIARLAASLGNEITFGVDNPLLPIPNIKFAIEVLNANQFHQAFEEIFDDPNMRDRLSYSKTVDRGRIIHTLRLVEGWTVNCAIIDDFVVFAPSIPLLRQTAAIVENRFSLDREQTFIRALPSRSGSHVSFLVYVSINDQLSQVLPFIMPEELRSQFAQNAHSVAQEDALVAYGIATENSLDFYIEGVKPEDYRMTNLVPALADIMESTAAGQRNP